MAVVVVVVVAAVVVVVVVVVTCGHHKNWASQVRAHGEGRLFDFDALEKSQAPDAAIYYIVLCIQIALTTYIILRYSMIYYTII